MQSAKTRRPITTVTGVRTSFLLLILSLTLSPRPLAAALTWGVSLSGSGEVAWQTSSPPDSGVITKSGKFAIDQGAIIDLTFIPAPGYYVSSIMKDKDDITHWLGWGNPIRFAGVGNSHKIKVCFDYIVPTGAMPLVFPGADIPGLIAIHDLTGNYQGVLPTIAMGNGDRAFNVDLAVDEAGKVEGMGTLEGFEAAKGAAFPVMGETKTVNGQPTLIGRGQFAGTVDGLTTTGKGSLTIPADLMDVDDTTPGDQLGGVGALSYSGVVDGAKVKDKDIPAMSEASAETLATLAGGRQWSVDIQIDYVGMDKPVLMASGVLNLPNATLDFPQKKVKYSPEKGFSLKFKGGVFRGTGTVDKKASVQIKAMTMEPDGMGWKVTGGDIAYAFLGQKGSGKVQDFVAP